MSGGNILLPTPFTPHTGARLASHLSSAHLLDGATDYKKSWIAELYFKIFSVITRGLKVTFAEPDFNGRRKKEASAEFVVELASAPIVALDEKRNRVTFDSLTEGNVVTVVAEDVSTNELNEMMYQTPNQLNKICPYFFDSLKNEIEARSGHTISDNDCKYYKSLTLKEISDFCERQFWGRLDLQGFFDCAVSMDINGVKTITHGVTVKNMQRDICLDALNNKKDYKGLLSDTGALTKLDQLCATGKKFIEDNIAGNLQKIGSLEFKADDLVIFKKIYNLDSLKHNVEALRTLPKLTKNEVAFLEKLRKDPDYESGWRNYTTGCLLRMLAEGLSSGLSGVYQHIFTARVMSDCVELADKLYVLELKPIDENDKKGDRSAPVILSSGRKDMSIIDERPGKGSSFALKIGERVEKMSRDESGDLTAFIKFTLTDNHKKHRANYEKFYSVNGRADRNNQLMQKLSQGITALERDFTSSNDNADKVDTTLNHVEQIKKDYLRSAGNYVQLGSNVVLLYTDLVTRDLKVTTPEISDVKQKLLVLMLDQRYRMFFGMSLDQRGSIDSGQTSYTLVISDDFETTHTAKYTGKTVLNGSPVEWEGTIKFSDGFYKKLEDGTFLNTNDMGIESIAFTKAQYVQTAEQFRQENLMAEEWEPEEVPLSSNRFFLGYDYNFDYAYYR